MSIEYTDIYNYSIPELFEKLTIKYKNNELSFEDFLQKYFIDNGMDEFIEKLYNTNYFDYYIDYNKFINDLINDKFPSDFNVESLKFTEIYYKHEMLFFDDFLIQYNENIIDIINKLIDLKYEFKELPYNKELAKKLLKPNIISKKLVDYFGDELNEYIKYNKNDENIANILINFGVKNVWIDYKLFIKNIEDMDLNIIKTINIKYYNKYYNIESFIEEFINDKNIKLIENLLDTLLYKKYPINKSLFNNYNSNNIEKWFYNNKDFLQD